MTTLFTLWLDGSFGFLAWRLLGFQPHGFIYCPIWYIGLRDIETTNLDVEKLMQYEGHSGKGNWIGECMRWNEWARPWPGPRLKVWRVEDVEIGLVRSHELINDWSANWLNYIGKEINSFKYLTWPARLPLRPTPMTDFRPSHLTRLPKLQIFSWLRSW